MMNLARGAVWRAEEERAARGGGRRGERDARGREEERRSVIMLRSDRQAVPSRERFHRHYKNVTQNAYRSFGPNEKVQTDYQHIRARPARIGSAPARLRSRAPRKLRTRERSILFLAPFTRRERLPAPPSPRQDARLGRRERGAQPVQPRASPDRADEPRPRATDRLRRGRVELQVVLFFPSRLDRGRRPRPPRPSPPSPASPPPPRSPPPRTSPSRPLPPPSPPFIASTRFASGSTTSRAPTTRARSRARTAKPPPRRSPSPARS